MINTKKMILKQMDEIYKEFCDLDEKHIKAHADWFFISECGPRVKKLITKIEVLISKYFEKTIYHNKMKPHYSIYDIYNLKDLMPHFLALFENFNNDYETLKKEKKISLKFERIIEEEVLKDNTFEEVIVEINGTYNDHYFTSMYIMVRKLLENLIYDCLKKYYGTNDVDNYYNTGKNRHQGYGVLINNFNQMIKEQNFKTNIGDVDQKFIDLLKEFQETGNRNAHSLFNLAHQDFIEKCKDKINNLIKKLDWVLEKL